MQEAQGQARRRVLLSDRMLLLEAAAWLGLVRVGLFLLPFQLLWKWIGRLQPRSEPPGDFTAEVEHLRWALRIAVKRIPGTCLVQALAGNALLARRGHPTTLRVGVARGDADEFKAHAWLEWRGKVIIGGPAVTDYTPLAEWNRVEKWVG